VTLQNGHAFDSNILNVNLGGCFLGEVAGLRGVGVRFQPMDDAHMFELVRWFNQVVGR